MPRLDDLFSATSTVRLRNFLVATHPRKRASTLKRPELVRLLLDAMVDDEISFFERTARSSFRDIDDLERLRPIVHRKLGEKYGTLLQPYLPSKERRLHPVLRRHLKQPVQHPPPVLSENIPMNGTSALSQAVWPQPVDSSVKDACMETFREQTNLSVEETCAVCGRRTFNNDILFSVRHIVCERVPVSKLNLEVLAVLDPHLLSRPEHHFRYGDPALDGLALHKNGIHVEEGGSELDVCNDCLGSLNRNSPRLPSLALANDNIRGYLPEALQDITWLEERLCAKYLASAYIVRLYDLTAPGAEGERPRVMKGHACSFPLNTISTATQLPWAVDLDAPLISCIIIGPRKPRTEDLRGVFKVRREKVRALLHYLREHCKGYPQFPVDEHALNSLPDDDVPELLMRHVTYEANDTVPSLFDQETTGLDTHPALLEDTDENSDDPRTFLEHHGLLDVNGVSIPAHERTASALASASGTERPDLVIRHGSTFVQDYNNPDLFPGMYPTLFPWGTGGFELQRRTALSFDRQAKYLLDITEPDFRRHWSFIFVVANIKQRRAIHHSSRFMCRARDFEHISAVVRDLTPATVKSVSEHLSRGGSGSTLTAHEAQIWTVLKKCQLISANVPGSRAIMIRARADIRGYIGHHGIFQLFLTLNPGPTHSPVFHIFFGDRTIRLDTQAPTMPSAKTRAIRVADDPVAAKSDEVPSSNSIQGHVSMSEADGPFVTDRHEPRNPTSHNDLPPTDQDPNEVVSNNDTTPHLATDDDDDDGLQEEAFMPLNTKGLAHQVEDYFNRGHTLAALSFYEFVRYVVLDKPPKERNSTHHDLAAEHPNVKTHIHRYTPGRPQGIPRCIISRFPRSDGTLLHGDDYCASMMAHFIPFTPSLPLKDINTTWEEAFAAATFPQSALAIMDNWAALNECISADPLRLLMHGEAGTGKTVVVRLLRELMDRYGRGNEIKFMAPTGKAASAIGGMTQHSAFGLDVHRRGLTTEERQDAQRDNQSKRMRFLQASFGHIRWLFFDEVSMTSCEVFHEIDQALRIGTQRLDEPFGGINVLFAGDLCQLPPVGAAPLYTRTSKPSLASSTRTKVELGRLSWLYINDVVEFTEQMRMKDADMAAALSRLRVRACTDDDAALFNTSVLYRPSAVQQVSVKSRRDLIVLAATNQTVRTLNVQKASSQAATQSLHLVTSHAIDDTNANLNIDARQALLDYNGRGESRVGIGRLPLFTGMSVVYRGPNQSVALGVTNGAFGKVVGWNLARDGTGLTIPKVAIVRFDDNATWQLTGLDPGCLPIYPVSSSFSFSLPENPSVVHRISRQQLPLQPGFAMTVHSAQGITSSGGVVVDLTRGGFPAYVAASRATRREDIFLISEVSRRQLNTPALPASLQSELARLQALAKTTKTLHDHDTWRLGHTNPLHEDVEPPLKRLRVS
ncbi:hypothetical protein CF319_g4767 [Tilletia indica]|nr:hypothetical protein CF319_g4767 [Tilletia indica]